MLVTTEYRNAVATITLHNPAKRGAMNFEAMTQLRRAFDEVAASDARAIILASEGSYFSSGHDLSEMSGSDMAWHKKFFTASGDLMMAIRRAPQPVIAQVHANCAAAGCQLVAGCDLAVASDAATFSIAGLKIGMFPTLPAVSLQRTVGHKMALRMLLTGDTITAEQALTHGLVSHVVPADDVESAAREVADTIAGYSSQVVADGKRAFYELSRMTSYETANHYAIGAVCENVMLPDGQEGINAFLEKRSPQWQHRK